MLVDASGHVPPGHRILAAQPARMRMALGQRPIHVAAAGAEILGDLRAGLAAADDQHRAIGKLPSIAVVAGVQYRQCRPGHKGNAGHPGTAVFAGGHHHRSGLDRSAAGFDGVAARLGRDTQDRAAFVDRQ